jgi:hypothetical protein
VKIRSISVETNIPTCKILITIILPELIVFIQPEQKVICNGFNANQMILEASCK